MTLIELKARAYDLLASIEQLQQALQATNAEIGRVAKAEQDKKAAEKQAAEAQEA